MGATALSADRAFSGAASSGLTRADALHKSLPKQSPELPCDIAVLAVQSSPSTPIPQKKRPHVSTPYENGSIQEPADTAVSPSQASMLSTPKFLPPQFLQPEETGDLQLQSRGSSRASSVSKRTPPLCTPRKEEGEDANVPPHLSVSPSATEGSCIAGCSLIVKMLHHFTQWWNHQSQELQPRSCSPGSS